LLCGLVPIVPTNIPDFDLLMPEEVQERLGIVRINSYQIDELRLATQSALQTYDRLGPEGALARHSCVLSHHMLGNRIAALLQMIHMLISGKLDIRFMNDHSGPGLRVEPTANPPANDDSDVEPPSSSIVLCNDRGLNFSAPASLNCMSSYVLLEQGRWFEKEVDFLYRAISPGMTAIDIGANIGTYSLALAQLVGPHGKVIAYEPGTENRRHLARSIKLNQLNNVTLSAAALSDTEGRGTLSLGGSGEFNLLISRTDPSIKTESVELTTLDAELARRNWTAIDFIKIDAEGQEDAILRGGRQLFTQNSPLVLFEINHGARFNYSLIEAFNKLGFQTYRLLGDGSALVAVKLGTELDKFELNCFAAKPALAARLAAKGLLVTDEDADWTLSPAERRIAIERYCALPFAESLGITPGDVENCPFADALVCYATYRLEPGPTTPRRLALLQKAYSQLSDFTSENTSVSALATLVRVGLDLGQRGRSVDALLTLANDPNPELDQPFFPPAARFEESSADAGSWFAYAVAEVLAVNESYSAICAAKAEYLGWLAEHQLASSDILRRRIAACLRDSLPRSELLPLITRLGVPTNPFEEAWSDAVFSLMGTS
jgi:FkbM family methyltransferase